MNLLIGNNNGMSNQEVIGYNQKDSIPSSHNVNEKDGIKIEDVTTNQRGPQIPVNSDTGNREALLQSSKKYPKQDFFYYVRPRSKSESVKMNVKEEPLELSELRKNDPPPLTEKEIEAIIQAVKLGLEDLGKKFLDTLTELDSFRTQSPTTREAVQSFITAGQQFYGKDLMEYAMTGECSGGEAALKPEIVQNILTKADTVAHNVVHFLKEHYHLPLSLNKDIVLYTEIQQEIDLIRAEYNQLSPQEQSLIDIAWRSYADTLLSNMISFGLVPLSNAASVNRRRLLVSSIVASSIAYSCCISFLFHAAHATYALSLTPLDISGHNVIMSHLGLIGHIAGTGGISDVPGTLPPPPPLVPPAVIDAVADPTYNNVISDLLGGAIFSILSSMGVISSFAIASRVDFNDAANRVREAETRVINGIRLNSKIKTLEKQQNKIAEKYLPKIEGTVEEPEYFPETVSNNRSNTFGSLNGSRMVHFVNSVREELKFIEKIIESYQERSTRES